MFGFRKRQSDDVFSKLCTKVTDVADQKAISKIDVVGAPDFENQISDAETEHSINFFKQFHLPMMKMAGIDLGRAAILELGAGLGQLAHGTLKSIEPAYYLATDVFPSLVASLGENLPRWSKNTTVGAALCDPQRDVFIKNGAFSVIQSHSVLHHVLDYRSAVKSLFDKLASPGVIIFTEPCLESYMFLCLMLKMFGKRTKLPEQLAQQVMWLVEHVEQRSGNMRDDKQFLSQFGTGDKYIYSAYDLFNLAEQIGARLHVQKDTRDPKQNLIYELKIRGGDEKTLSNFGVFLDEVLPVGIEKAYFSDLRQVFCFIK
jgi:SAM-dependent methyltransferase